MWVLILILIFEIAGGCSTEEIIITAVFPFLVYWGTYSFICLVNFIVDKTR